MKAAPRVLAGLRILVVEDRFLIAEEMRKAVTTLGGLVVGPYARLADASLAAAREPIDAAILDVNLDGEQIFALAAELGRREVPYVFATGYEDWVMPAEFLGVPRLQKPVTVDGLAAALGGLARGGPD